MPNVLSNLFEEKYMENIFSNQDAPVMHPGYIRDTSGIHRNKSTETNGAFVLDRKY